jgi:hypothetical protein
VQLYSRIASRKKQGANRQVTDEAKFHQPPISLTSLVM